MGEFELGLRPLSLRLASYALALVVAVCFGPSPVAALSGFVVLGLGLFIARRAGRTLSFDQGGIRADGAFGRRYLPLSRIARVRLADSDRVRIEDADGRPLREFKLGSCSARARFYAELTQRLDLDGCSRHSCFARDGKSLATWCNALAALVIHRDDGAGYRRAATNLEQAAEILRDAHAPVDERAGAAFALLTAGDAQSVLDVRAAITRDAPPLLVALAALAPHGRPYHRPALALVDYLEPEDRAFMKSRLGQDGARNSDGLLADRVLHGEMFDGCPTRRCTEN